MAQNIIEWAESVLDQYRNRIARITGLNPANVVFRLGDLPDGTPAETSGNVVTLDRQYFKNNRDAGAIVHEAVHAYLGSDSTGGEMDRIHEQLADFVRGKLGLANESSTETAKFFTWLSEQDPSAVKELAKAMGAGTFEAGTFKQIVGVSYNDAQTVYQQQDELPSVPSPRPPYLSDGSSTGGTGVDTTFDSSGVGGDEGLTEAEKRAKRQQDRNQFSSYVNLVSEWGMDLTPNLTQLANEAARKNYSMATFLRFLRQTPEYHQEFKGIFNKDGSLRMTENQYIRTMEAYDTIAAQSGIDLSKQDKVWAIRHDVTGAELATRAEAISALDRNPQMFKAFTRELIQGGLSDGPVKRADLLKFILKQDNSDWKDLWQDAVTRNSAVMAGITFKKHSEQYVNLRQGVIERVSRLGLSPEASAQAFGEIEQLLSEALPSSRISHLGLSKKGIVKAVIGGPGSAQARQRIKRVIATADAADKNETAAGASYTNQQGGFTVAGSNMQRRASE